MIQTVGMLKYLEEAFPDRYPDVLRQSDKEIYMHAGRIEVIRLIRHKLEEVQESLPEVLK